MVLAGAAAAVFVAQHHLGGVLAPCNQPGNFQQPLQRFQVASASRRPEGFLGVRERQKPRKMVLNLSSFVAETTVLLAVHQFMGGDTTPSSAVVQTGGHAYRLERRWLQQEFARGTRLQSLLLRYTQALITQMAQTAACNRHHSVEQQLCRWLLLTLDRMPSRELVMTQELVASMLGVRRESVTEAAGRLQQAGYIRYRRGHIGVLDRAGLEGRACECYAVVKKEIDRLLPDARGLQEQAVPRSTAN